MKWKMAKVQKGIPCICIVERAVNVEEFLKLNITQKLEALGWQRALNWCLENTLRIYLIVVTEWLASLKFENKSSHTNFWKLTGETSGGQMVMSFETMNQVAEFDSLGTNTCVCLDINHFCSQSVLGGR
ncbi:hypothetical protein Hanom_Chr13g01196141 [Helianthus anomalus]